MKRRFALLLFAFASLAAHATPARYDVVVYGGTSGGVAAAVEIARSGKTVVLLSPTLHLGGLTSSGLGWTDLGDASILGGLSREFYHRAYQHYRQDAAWNWQTRASYGNAGQGGPAFDAAGEIASVFEPKVAEQIFNQWIQEAQVPVVTGRLDLTAQGVVMDGRRIARIRLEDGREFAGGMFIDASYEGDLLPGAGVSFTLGREANATYGETYNGVQTTRATKNQLRDHIDPYVTPGDPASGLLPGVSADPALADGAGDARLQAYCYRMVLTDVAANRIAVAQPADYREADYELLFRSIEAGQTTGFFKLDLMPNRKTDSNNTGGISTDFIGGNYGADWNWPGLGHQAREAVAKKHQDWQRGLIWTLQNHPRVPDAIRNAYAKWGLPADEFADNGHWPYQLYVREARRMVSDLVMTQHHCDGSQVVPDSIGLAAYAMDSHHVRRQIVNGMVKNEGDVQMTVGRPYPISYRSIVPKAGECTNLLVPWSLSASHMAFGSIRMEPVFMTLAQSAAIAARLAIDENLAVQDLPYATLRPRLIAAGQALGEASPAIIIDNRDTGSVEITGAWTAGASTAGYVGADYLHDGNADQGAKQVFFHLPPGSSAGLRKVDLRWTAHTNRASNVTVEVRHAQGTAIVSVDQRSNGGKWNRLGVFSFSGAAGEGVIVKNAGANGYVIADAVGYTPVVAGVDSDGDGLTDEREISLGLDPDRSDAALISAIRLHPAYFGLHSAGEIQDFRLAAAWLSPVPPRTFGFDLQAAASPSWELFENFQLPVASEGPRRFFRVAARTEASKLVRDLAAGLSRKVVVYGTSLTANGAWVGRLNQWLAAKYPGRLTVINSGLSGKNSAEGLAQLETKVLAHQPDTVFIEFAMNDAFRYSDGTPSLSVPQARANLLAMIDAILARKPDTEIVLQTMNSVWDSPSGSNASATLRPQLSDYYQMYRTVAAERRLTLIDHHPYWQALEQSAPATFHNYVPDGVHPTAAGLDEMMVPLLQWKLSGGKPLP